MLRRDCRRRLVRAGAIDDHLDVAWIGSEHVFYFAGMGGDGAGNDSVAQARLARTHVENNRALAAVDHVRELADGDAVHPQTADEELPLDPADEQIDGERTGDRENTEFAELDESRHHCVYRAVKHAAKHDG